MSAVGTGRNVVVTGGSRGVGAELVSRLTDRGDTVVFCYRDKRARAARLASAAAARGGRATAVRADLTDADDRRELVRVASETLEGVDVLILCASGGLERDRGQDYARRLNRDAQVDLVQRALPWLRPGGRVVFLTSHQAHFVREVAVEDDYALVAEAKRVGEDALRELIPVLTACEVDLVVVSADMLEDSTTTALLERLTPGATAARRQELGSLPTTASFAAAVVAMLEAEVDTGHVELHGGAAWYDDARSAPVPSAGLRRAPR